MTRERYQIVESLFGHAISIADAAARASFVEEATSGDEDLAAQVRELLESYDSWSAPLCLPAPVLMRVGPYECVRQLGAGGMGTVYLARRVDGQFEHEVAIKFLRSSMQGDVYRARFAAERQILAHLNHPNIARLLDGGMTPEGEPYLVMEYIEGEDLDAYCGRHGFQAAQRIRLFEQVLAAVDAAHRNLVVHRDLKPSNILVTKDGLVKLLDFGTSKLLENRAQVTEIGALTPAYASPEQLRGEPVATTSDVFSLGAVLFELLTGNRPFPGATSYATNLERSLRDIPPVRSGLPHDLDAVLHKALAWDPGARYASVAAFGEDLRRYLEGRPVVAREPHWSYIAARFIRRHKQALAALCIALAILGGAAVYAWRQQLQAAQRFEESRQISRYVLFELFDEVSQLPGSTPLRARMAETAQAQLDKLASLPLADLSLRLDTAKGYNRLAEVYGVPGMANLGDPRASLANLERAGKLLEALPGGALERARAALLEAKIQMYTNGQTVAARPLVERAEQELEAARDPGDVAWLNLRSMARQVRGDLLDFENQWDEEGKNAREGLEELDAWPADARLGASYPVYRAHLMRQLGNAHYYAERAPEALQSYQQALAILTEARGRMPNQPAVLAATTTAGYDVGTTLALMGRREESVEVLQETIRVADRLLAIEDRDRNLARNYGIVRQALAELLAQSGRIPEAIAEQRKVVEERRRLWNADPEQKLLERDVAFSMLVLGNLYVQAGDRQAGCEAWRESSLHFESLRRANALTDWDRTQAIKELERRLPGCAASPQMAGPGAVR